MWRLRRIEAADALQIYNEVSDKGRGGAVETLQSQMSLKYIFETGFINSYNFLQLNMNINGSNLYLTKQNHHWKTLLYYIWITYYLKL